MKKSNLKTLSSVLLAVFTSVTLVACGGGGGESQNAAAFSVKAAALRNDQPADAILAELKQRAEAEKQQIASSATDPRAANSGMAHNAEILSATMQESRQKSEAQVR
jgi:hypothetical protein